MDKAQLLELLTAVQGGGLDPAEAAERLSHLPYDDVGFARLDTHRSLRTGYPEAIFAQNKTPQQTAVIFQRLIQHHSRVLVTRADRAAYEAVRELTPQARYHELARLITWGEPPEPSHGLVLIVAAGTADLPVAEEAALTAQWMGQPVERLYDVGVAGIHRLLASQELLRKARVLVVVAGMEGALASVVGGLVTAPVIACPTSVGYGAHFGGLAPLLAMLNSCASGVAVVNIDNGYGAGTMAAIINAQSA